MLLIVSHYLTLFDIWHKCALLCDKCVTYLSMLCFVTSVWHICVCFETSNTSEYYNYLWQVCDISRYALLFDNCVTYLVCDISKCVTYLGIWMLWDKSLIYPSMLWDKQHIWVLQLFVKSVCTKMLWDKSLTYLTALHLQSCSILT